MHRLAAHLRTVYLAGVLAAIPVVVTVVVIWYVERITRDAVEGLFGARLAPFVGVGIAVGLIYVLGLFVTSLVGRAVLRVADALLGRLPIVRSVYVAWKHVAITPGGGEGMYAKVVLVPDDGSPDAALLIGFTSGRPVTGMADHLPVFVPQSPNPINGRLMLVPRARCRMTDLAPDEALKLLLSIGNYLPAGLTMDAAGPGQPRPPARRAGRG